MSHSAGAKRGGGRSPKNVSCHYNLRNTAKRAFCCTKCQNWWFAEKVLPLPPKKKTNNPVLPPTIFMLMPPVTLLEVWWEQNERGTSSWVIYWDVVSSAHKRLPNLKYALSFTHTSNRLTVSTPTDMWLLRKLCYVNMFTLQSLCLCWD